MDDAYFASTLYGATPQAPSWAVAAPTQAMGMDDLKTGWRALVDPRNPLLWFGAVLLVTVGAAGVAGAVRLGPVRAAASVGSTG